MLQTTSLRRLPFHYRILFTGFLLVIGIGLLMAGAQIMMTHGKADGKPGISLEDIVYSYYGNRNGSKLQTMLNGAMKPMAPADARFELDKWAQDGAPLNDWNSEIKPIIEKYCISCHNADSSLPDFNKYENVQKLAEIDKGISYATLTRVSHIHLFGIAFIFFFVGWIFSMAECRPRWKYLLIATPFVFLIVDVLSWWLTKLSPFFAWLTILGGIGYSLAATDMVVTSLAQMWLPQHYWPKFWNNGKE